MTSCCQIQPGGETIVDASPRRLVGHSWWQQEALENQCVVPHLGDVLSGQVHLKTAVQSLIAPRSD